MKCPQCGKNTMITKCYNRKSDGAFKKIDLCFTKGCGYIKDYTSDVPSIAAVKASREVKQGQKEFSF